MKNIFVLVVSMLFILHISESVAQYSSVGGTIPVQTCFSLTSNNGSRNNGAIWDSTKIDLRKDFDVTYYVVFGCKDDIGADGIAIVIHNDPRGLRTLGGAQNGLGYNGIRPSIAIEMDTYNNQPGYGVPDIVQDHIAVVENGNIMTNAAGPVLAKSNGANIEDCECHSIRLLWFSKEKKLVIFFDGEERLTYNKDIINSIFSGVDSVFIGVTASTGGYQNEQSVCPSPIPSNQRIVLSDGIEMPILKARKGYSNYSWTPAYLVECPTCPETKLKSNQPGTYYLNVVGPLGCTMRDSVVVTQAKLPPPPVLYCSETDCESVVISLTEQETGGIQHLEIASPSNVVITENTFRPGSTQATIAAEAESPFADAVFTVRQYSSSYRALERVVVIPGFTISADSVITTFRPVNNYLCDSVYFYNPSNRFQQFTYAFSTADSVIFPPTFDENTVLLAPKTGVRVPVCYLLRPSGVATVNLTFQDACGRRKVKELKKYFVPSTVADKGEEQSSWVEIRGNVLRAKADCTIKLYDILGKEVLMRMLIAEQLEELPKGHYAIVIEKGLQVERFVIVIE